MRPSSFMNTVIFDTNLLLDFFVFHNQETSVLWTAAKERKFKTVTCEGAVAELEDVLKRPQFKISAEQLESIREEFLSVAEIFANYDRSKSQMQRSFGSEVHRPNIKLFSSPAHLQRQVSTEMRQALKAARKQHSAAREGDRLSLRR